MSGADLVGYGAAGLVLAAFCMRRMVPLRLVALASNAAFIAYALLADLHPVLVLHAVLLPLNLLRLAETRDARPGTTARSTALAVPEG